MKTIHIILLLPLAFLTGCAGLSASYTQDVGGQSLTGFIASDGTYGIIGKKAETGKLVVPTK